MPGKQKLSMEMIESARISGIKTAGLADELGLHPSTIHQFCKSRGLPPLKGGHRDIIDQVLAKRLPDYFKRAVADFCRDRGTCQRDFVILALTEFMIRAGVNPHEHRPEEGAASPAKPTRRKKGSLTWGDYPIRTCRTMHACTLCGQVIKAGECYYDGNIGRRTHVKCYPKRGET